MGKGRNGNVVSSPWKEEGRVSRLLHDQFSLFRVITILLNFDALRLYRLCLVKGAIQSLA